MIIDARENGAHEFTVHDENGNRRTFVTRVDVRALEYTTVNSFGSEQTHKARYIGVDLTRKHIDIWDAKHGQVPTRI